MFLQALGLVACLVAVPAAPCDQPADPRVLHDIAAGDVAGGLSRAGIPSRPVASPEWYVDENDRARPMVMPRLRAMLPDGILHMGFRPRADDGPELAALSGRQPVALHGRLLVARPRAELERLVILWFGPPQRRQRDEAVLRMVWCDVCDLLELSLDDIAACRSDASFPANHDRTGCGGLVEVLLRDDGAASEIVLHIDDHWQAGEALRRLAAE